MLAPAEPNPGGPPRPYLSFLLPCYNEGAVLPETYRRVKAVADDLGKSYEIVLVNDGSSDDTLPQMLQFAQRDLTLVIVNLSRNHGHQLALSAGLPGLARADSSPRRVKTLFPTHLPKRQRL